jgi:hypothetical protein
MFGRERRNGDWTYTSIVYVGKMHVSGRRMHSPMHQSSFTSRSERVSSQYQERPRSKVLCHCHRTRTCPVSGFARMACRKRGHSTVLVFHVDERGFFLCALRTVSWCVGAPVAIGRVMIVTTAIRSASEHRETYPARQLLGR